MNSENNLGVKNKRGPMFNFEKKIGVRIYNAHTSQAFIEDNPNSLQTQKITPQ